MSDTMIRVVTLCVLVPLSLACVLLPVWKRSGRYRAVGVGRKVVLFIVSVDAALCILLLILAGAEAYNLIQGRSLSIPAAQIGVMDGILACTAVLAVIGNRSGAN